VALALPCPPLWISLVTELQLQPQQRQGHPMGQRQGSVAEMRSTMANDVARFVQSRVSSESMLRSRAVKHSVGVSLQARKVL
jgi:hypothetical protein